MINKEKQDEMVKAIRRKEIEVWNELKGIRSLTNEEYADALAPFCEENDNHRNTYCDLTDYVRWYAYVSPSPEQMSLPSWMTAKWICYLDISPADYQKYYIRTKLNLKEGQSLVCYGVRGSGEPIKIMYNKYTESIELEMPCFTKNPTSLMIGILENQKNV